MNDDMYGNTAKFWVVRQSHDSKKCVDDAYGAAVVLAITYVINIRRALFMLSKRMTRAAACSSEIPMAMLSMQTILHIKSTLMSDGSSGFTKRD